MTEDAQILGPPAGVRSTLTLRAQQRQNYHVRTSTQLYRPRDPRPHSIALSRLCLSAYCNCLRSYCLSVSVSCGSLPHVYLSLCSRAANVSISLLFSKPLFDLRVKTTIRTSHPSRFPFTVCTSYLRIAPSSTLFPILSTSSPWDDTLLYSHSTLHLEPTARGSQ